MQKHTIKWHGALAVVILSAIILITIATHANSQTLLVVAIPGIVVGTLLWMLNQFKLVRNTVIEILHNITLDDEPINGRDILALVDADEKFVDLAMSVLILGGYAVPYMRFNGEPVSVHNQSMMACQFIRDENKIATIKEVSFMINDNRIHNLFENNKPSKELIKLEMKNIII